MGRLTEMEKYPEWHHEELIFTCDAGDGEYFRITWDDDPDWRMATVEAYTRPRKIRDRIKWAWRALRGEEVYGSIIILNDRAVEELKTFFNMR